jgi:hypothetical protein
MFLAIACAAFGCSEIPATSAVPGLFGVMPTASADRPSPAVLEHMREWRKPDAECVGNTYGGIAVVGDVVGDGGAQTVLASYDHVVVLDARNALLAAAPSELDCAGSADAIEAVAIGRTWLDAPVIVVAATTGGRAEHTSTVTLYRVAGRTLVPLFRGVVLAREGESAWYGSITIVPGGGLVYRAPGDPMTWWTLDGASGRYVLKEARSGES